MWPFNKVEYDRVIHLMFERTFTNNNNRKASLSIIK